MMGKLLLIIGAISVFALLWFGSKQKPNKSQLPPWMLPRTQHITNMFTLTSSAFANGAKIPPLYTCDGDNSAPPLEISEVPPTAKSLALIVDDPDAPMGAWVHWLVWNLPSTTARIEGELPTGAVEGVTSFGKPGYGGPCPPSGSHRYFFKLSALDTTLDLPVGTNKSALESAMQGHVIEQAELMGTYAR